MTDVASIPLLAVVELAVRASLLLLLLLGALRLMARAAAGTRHVVLAVGLAAVLGLPAATLVAPTWSIIGPTRWLTSPLTRTSGRETSAVPLTETVGTSSLPAAPANSAVPATPTPAASDNPGQDLGRTLLSLWLGGTLAMLVRLGWGMLAIRRVERGSMAVTDPTWMGAVRDAGRRLGLRTPVTLLQGPVDSAPMTWGLARPVIWLPASASEWSDERRGAVVAHELAHIHRRDTATQWLGHLALAVHWFNPLAWIAAARLTLEGERACDDVVLSLGESAEGYAEQLLGVGRLASGGRSLPAPAMAMARASQLRRRVESILDGSIARSPASPRHVWSVSTFALAALGLVGGAHVYAQGEITLGPPTIFPAEFTFLTSARELKDGSVLITDVGENVLKHLDPRTGVATQVSRKGQGPMEYQMAGAVYPLKADTSLLLDPAFGRREWIYLVAAEIVGRAPAAQAELRVAAGMALGADTLGRVLTQQQIRWDIPRGGDVRIFPDSQVIMLTAAGLARVDTIARVQAGTSAMATAAGIGASGPANYGMTLPYETGVQAHLFLDGWLAIAYPDPYRVDWRRPDGSFVRGASIPGAQVPVDAQQKAFASERPGIPHGGPNALGYQRVLDRAWPEMLPPFIRRPEAFLRVGLYPVALSLQAAPDGRLLILRTTDARTPEVTRYDVIDRRGTRSGTLTLGATDRIVGFGPQSIYIVASDADDIQRLRRQAWPMVRQ